MSSDEHTSKALPSTSNEEPASEEIPSVSPSGATESKSRANEYIQVRVMTTDDTNQVLFRIKAFTDLGRLKRSYCAKLGLDINELRFVFDGVRITDEDTPKKLGLINGDVIEVFQEKIGGM